MEHRWSVRHPATIKVLLQKNGTSIAHCKTRNISRDGLFVETGPLVYRRNTLLRIEFEHMREGVSQRQILPAFVVHVSQEGLGLMFMQSNSYDFICSHKLFVQDYLDNVEKLNRVQDSTQVISDQFDRLTG